MAGGRLPAVAPLAVEHVHGQVGTVVVARALVAPWPVESSRIRDQPVSPALVGGFSSTGPPDKS